VDVSAVYREGSGDKGVGFHFYSFYTLDIESRSYKNCQIEIRFSEKPLLFGIRSLGGPMNEIAAARELSSAEFARLLSVYFRGLFFKPLAFETEGLHPGVGNSPLDKELFIPYLKENGIMDLRKMASEKPFDSLFPLDARTKNADEKLWPDLEKSVRRSKKAGGFIRVFIEKQDSHFMSRAKAFLPDIVEDGDFSIPEDFFVCLAGSGVYLYATRDEDNKIRDLRWDFDRLEPPLAHALKPHKRAISVYDAYEWYGERRTRLWLSARINFPGKNAPISSYKKAANAALMSLSTPTGITSNKSTTRKSILRSNCSLRSTRCLKRPMAG
jgi:hypothetical protein